MRPLIFFFILITSVNSKAQKNVTNEIIPDWKDITIVDGVVPDSLPKILVVTNRPFYPDDKEGEYFPNKISEYRKVTYVELGNDNGKWLGKIHSKFEFAIKSVNKGKDILLFIHGHGKSFPHSISRAMLVKERYDVSLILFDWPAKNGNFSKSLARVRRCGGNFYNLLQDLETYKLTSMTTEQSLSILAHSLGNYFLTHFITNGSSQYLNKPFIDNIIFNAPAVRSKEHGEVISQIKIATNKYVVFNKNDMILRSAQFLTFGRMLGNVVIPPYASKTDYIDFTNIAKREHSYFVGYHIFERDNLTVYTFYNTIIHGNNPTFLSLDYAQIRENEYMIK